MKKITAFFMAIMPIFITALLFISGMIVKDSTHIYVTGVEIVNDNIRLKQTDYQQPATEEIVTNILPKNATNPEVYWNSADTNIAQVNDKGEVTSKDYGETYVYATSKENPLLKAKCKVEVWDDKIHKIVVGNSYNAEYLNYYQTLKLDTKPIPSSDLKVDPTLEFSSDNPNVVQVFPDGTLKASEIDGTANITIKTKNQKDPEVSTSITVKVGPGAIKMEAKDKSKQVTSATNFNFRDQVIVYPDNTIPAKDFKYTSSDETVATVSNDTGKEGQVTYHKPGTASITATYKRDANVTETKTITSTCEYLKDVYFNRYTFDADLSTYPIGSELPISYSTYPVDLDNSNVVFSTTNQSCVYPYQDENKQWKFKVNGPGSAILKAMITLDFQGNTKEDYCLVNITGDISEHIFKQASVTTDSYYYAARNNINQDAIVPSQSIVWAIEAPNNDATIDANTGVIYFDKSATAETVKVKATIGANTHEFSLSFDPAEAKTLPSYDYEYKIQVGTKYNFGSQYLTSSDMTSDSFDMETSGLLGDRITSFIPKKGGIYTARLHGLLIGRRIRLVVEEKPCGISYKPNSEYYYITTQPKFNFRTIFEPKTIPDTATDENGNACAISFEYEYPDPQIVKIQDDEIECLDRTIVLAKAKTGNIESNWFAVNCLLDDIGKFTIKDSKDKEIVSGDSIHLEKNVPVEFKLNNLLPSAVISEGLLGQFNFESLNGNNNIQFNKRFENDQIIFTLTAKDYGSDVVAISSGTFKLILNVSVENEIDQFDVYYHGQKVEANKNNITYVNNMKLNIVATPLSAKNAISAQIVKNKSTPEETKRDLTVTEDRTITIPSDFMDAEGNYELTISAQKKSLETVKYVTTLNYKKQIALDSFTFVEAQEGNNLYIKATDTQLISTIKVDGFVDDAFFNNFKAEIDSQTITPSFNKIYYDKIPAPTDDTPGYTSKIKLTCISTGQEKEFNVCRDIVSKIVLPKNDMYDETDKKGLQKVHVYGDQSWYSKEENKLDYYKLEIKLYNYKNKEIVDTIENKAKHKAYDTLVKSMTNQNVAKGSMVYHEPDSYNKDGFIEIHFDPTSLYTKYELCDDDFAKQVNKNVYFSIRTKGYATHSEYNFVATKGTNAYCIMPFIGQPQDENQAIILQTNFGKENATKDNVEFKFADWPTNIIFWLYGNGYTINLADWEKTHRETQKTQYWFMMYHMMNVDIQGISSDLVPIAKNPDSNIKYHISLFESTSKAVVAYNIIRNFPQGVSCEHKDQKDILFKNCLFYNSVEYGIKNTRNDFNLYVQDCVFFNSAAFPIWLKGGANVYLKGKVDFYNFKSKNDFKKIEEAQIPFLGDIIFGAAGEKMIQYDAAGIPVINSSICYLLTNNIHFYIGQDESGKDLYDDYATQGNPLAAEHVYNFANIPLPIVGGVGMWGTRAPAYDKNAPKYSDEYDSSGNIKSDFLWFQIEKLTRKESKWY